MWNLRNIKSIFHLHFHMKMTKVYYFEKFYQHRGKDSVETVTTFKLFIQNEQLICSRFSSFMIHGVLFSAVSFFFFCFHDMLRFWQESHWIILKITDSSFFRDMLRFWQLSHWIVFENDGFFFFSRYVTFLTSISLNCFEN